MFKVHRYHDICAGHRVVGHENKCRHLHGHNYRVHFTCEAEQLDHLGRVVDFSVVKERLCMWIENNWDHRFLHWENDPMITAIKDSYTATDQDHDYFVESLVSLPFNPTAENLAQYLVDVVGPEQLRDTGIVLTEVKIEETAKCHASYCA